MRHPADRLAVMDRREDFDLRRRRTECRLSGRASGDAIVLLMSSTAGTRAATEDLGLLDALLGDGLPALGVTALGLIAAGLFAWFLAVTDQLLPHDLAYLSIAEHELRAIADGRVVHFMAHDRAAFGGTLVAIGVLYLWLIRFPLADGRGWAWCLLALTGSLGFLSFLTYLPTGYLDTWHGVATLALLVPFVVGIARSRRHLRSPLEATTLLRPAPRLGETRGHRWGRRLVLLTGFGMLVAGTTIATIGSVVVFVPQDLAYMGLDRAALDAIDPRLVPLIAHDRAGFGGGLAVAGLTVLGCVWCAPISRSLWEALIVAGAAGFGGAIGVHGLVGYTDVTHVGPAVLGALVFAAGMALARPEGQVTDGPQT
jgi:hypothetical protein